MAKRSFLDTLFDDPFDMDHDGKVTLEEEIFCTHERMLQSEALNAAKDSTDRAWGPGGGLFAPDDELSEFDNELDWDTDAFGDEF